jgi:seryl-tRNA synthetase
MDDNTVVTGEVVEEAAEEEVPQSSSAKSDEVTVLLSLEELIKNNIAAIDKLAEELKQHKQMLDDAFNNDPAFREHTEKVKEATKQKAEAKANITKQTQVMQLANKVKTMASELKEIQGSLSDYLKEYLRLSGGVNEIQGHDGRVREILTIARLIVRAEKKEKR